MRSSHTSDQLVPVLNRFRQSWTSLVAQMRVSRRAKILAVVAILLLVGPPAVRLLGDLWPSWNDRLRTALLELRAGHYTIAEEQLLALLKAADKSDELDSRRVQVLFPLGWLYQATGREQQAREAFQAGLRRSRRAVEVCEFSGRCQQHLLVTHLAAWGQFSEALGDHAEAESAYSRLLSLREKEYGPDASALIDVLEKLGRFARLQGKLLEAETYYRRAITLAARVHGLGSRSVREYTAELEKVLREAGRDVGAQGTVGAGPAGVVP